MRIRRWSLVLLVALAACAAPRVAAPLATAPPVVWEEYGAAPFERARGDDRIVLLTIAAAWCHWCHVMDAETYTDPRVRELLARDFVTVRADADARPDLAERYRRYGWPAIAFLTGDGTPLLNVRGYRDADTFAGLLADLAAQRRAGTLRPLPDDEPARDAPPVDLARARDVARARLDAAWDDAAAGWGTGQKYPRGEPIVATLVAAALQSGPADASRAERTLVAQTALIDPVWGGMYQYSERGVWTEPHFEKIAPVQAGALTAYAAAVRVGGRDGHARALHDVARYVRTFLRDERGAFLTSQDADLGAHDAPGHVPGAVYYALDDAARRARGIPRIDRNVYADRNGMLVAAFVDAWAATGDTSFRDDAARAADVLLATHATHDGAFRHAAGDDALLHLGDTAWMGEALTALAQATGAPRYADAARRAATFLTTQLAAPDGGFYAHTEEPGAPGALGARREPPVENAVAARFLVRLGRDVGDDALVARGMAVLRAFAHEDAIRAQGLAVGTYLLALEEALDEPPHVTIVARPGDPAADAFRAEALAQPWPFRDVETRAPGGAFPDLGHAVAYLCAGARCSSPIETPEDLVAAATLFFLE